tara:strand:+ start:760 stop:1155 length:396 start_codon:yes stop_codon:yes gene_type:complete
MIWDERNIDLELALTAWHCYDYTYPREFPNVLYVTMTGVSDTDTGQPCLKYVRSWNLDEYAKPSGPEQEQFLAATSLTEEEWEKVPIYECVNKEHTDKTVHMIEYIGVRVAFLVLGGAYATLAIFAFFNCI